MSVNISLFAGAGAQFFDNNGVPLTGGLLYTYSAGTTTPSATYTSITGSIANSNPIVLDSAGRVSNEIWLTNGNTYKFILQTSTGVQIGSWDNISGAFDQTALASSIGSSLVGYNEGGTGAVTTTVQTKLRESVSVFDFIPPAEHDAIRGGTSTYDCTADFITAFNYIQLNGNANEFSGNWPTDKKWTLTGPAGVYNFSDSFVTPVNSRPNYVNFDIVFNGSQFKALPTYNTANSLIHMKAAYDYVIQGIGFTGFKTSYVIFNDSSLTQNYGGKTVYRDLRFADCDYGIRHELESVVAIIDQCMTDSSIKKFLTVWRADQALIRDCYFNWSQLNKSSFDSYISFGTDQYANSETDTAHYNQGRLTVENCMFIPVDSPVTYMNTAWVEMVSGNLIMRGCHCGPESTTSRPYAVLSRIQGALFSSPYELIDAGITIEDCSLVTSGLGLIYLAGYYPNYIRTRNIRWNTLDYYGGGTEEQYYVTGDSTTLNGKSAVYTSVASQFFKFDFGSSSNEAHTLIPFDPRLNFPRSVSIYTPVSIGDTSNTAIANAQLMTFDFNNRDSYPYNLPLTGALFDVTINGNMHSGVGPDQYNCSFKGIVEIGTSVTTMTIGYASVYTPAFIGATVLPNISAVFVNNAGGVEFSSILNSDAVSGNYFIRLKVLAATGNDFRGGTVRFHRII